MVIRIKRADVTDLDELMRWREVVLREVFSIPKEKNMDDLLTANREYYHTALKREEHLACFAYADEYADAEPVGCGGICLYQEMPSPDNPSGKCAYLMNIYTVPAVSTVWGKQSSNGWCRKQSAGMQAKFIWKRPRKRSHSIKSLDFMIWKAIINIEVIRQKIRTEP